MAKYLENKIVKFISFSDIEGNPINDWHDNYMNCAGMLCIYESEHKAPGKKYIYFFPNEPDNDDQRYFNSGYGTLTESDKEIIVEDGHRYVLKKETLYLGRTLNCCGLTYLSGYSETAKRVMAMGGGYIYLS